MGQGAVTLHRDGQTDIWLQENYVFNSLVVFDIFEPAESWREIEHHLPESN